MPVSRKPEPTPYWKSECGRAVVYLGDCKEVMNQLKPEQFHAIVTDPPYGLEFMGKEWDAPWKNQGKIETFDEGTDKSYPENDRNQRVCYGNNIRGAVIRNPATERGGFQDGNGGNPYSRSRIEFGRDSQMYQDWFSDRAAAMLRVARPGAHLLSFGGTRMWHRMACAIEDAGFDIRDTIMWTYGSGFPKSMNISKQIDKMMGTKGTPVCITTDGVGNTDASLHKKEGFASSRDKVYVERRPTTDAAKRWDGWGTSLKPSFEPIMLARKPIQGTVAGNTLEHGCGGINVDGCRVATKGNAGDISMNGGFAELQRDGRWPANLIHDGSDEVMNLFPQSQSSKAVMPLPKTPGDSKGSDHGNSYHKPTLRGFDDNGSAARFFYTVKADADDRRHMSDSEITHPTVKPLDLMKYLVRLVCAKGGTVLDPFMGSGSTGVAAVEDEVYFVGIEQSEEYAKIAVDRIKAALGTHPHLIKRLETGKVVVKDTLPTPTRLG